MKKLFLSLAMITFIAGTLSTSIGQIPDKVAIQNPGTLTETRKNILVVNKVSPVVASIHINVANLETGLIW